MSHLIAPSFLSADFANLENDIKMINKSNADWFHLDIMDGMFVPNISFGFPVISHIKKYSEKPLDVHLMIYKPERYIKEFRNAGADILTVHYEACTHLHGTIQLIKDNGMKAAVALNPHTPINLLSDIIADLDMVLLMSVNPGFGGQKFINNTYNKIAQVKKLITEKQLNTLIQVDGGVAINNAKQLIDTGVDILVAGSAVFNSQNPIETIHLLKGLRPF